MSFEPSLILFDVDGTLVDCGPQVRPLLRQALERVYGVAVELDGADFAGKTDDQIVFELMGSLGLPRAAIADGLDEMRWRYVELLDRELDADGIRLLPGVVDALDELDRRPGVAVGLLTGNWEGGARIKLARCGLDAFFAFGAYGDGVEDRCELPPRALERARRATGRPYGAGDALIVGDTGRDVACAHAHGIRALGVATGPASEADLSAAGADWVTPDLASASILRQRVVT